MPERAVPHKAYQKVLCALSLKERTIKIKEDLKNMKKINMTTFVLLWCSITIDKEHSDARLQLSDGPVEEVACSEISKYKIKVTIKVLDTCIPHMYLPHRHEHSSFRIEYHI